MEEIVLMLLLLLLLKILKELWNFPKINFL